MDLRFIAACTAAFAIGMAAALLMLSRRRRDLAARELDAERPVREAIEQSDQLLNAHRLLTLQLSDMKLKYDGMQATQQSLMQERDQAWRSLIDVTRGAGGAQAMLVSAMGELYGQNAAFRRRLGLPVAPPSPDLARVLEDFREVQMRAEADAEKILGTLRTSEFKPAPGGASMLEVLRTAAKE
jgi:hypothetical protein